MDDGTFIPVAASGRVKLFCLLSGGLDLGYAFGLADYLDGGVYYRPVIGFEIADTKELTASYEGTSDTAEWGNFNVGVLFAF